jgi:hypothetical protein
MRIVNSGVRAFLTEDKLANGDRISVRFDLPPGAETVEVIQRGVERFSVGVGPAPVVQSTSPIKPGAPVALLFSYTLPLSGHLDLALRTRYSVDLFTALVPENADGLIHDSAFEQRPTTTIDGREYSPYRLNRALQAGETLRFQVLVPEQLAGERRTLLIAIAAGFLAVVAGAVGVIGRLKRRRGAPTAPSLTPADVLIQTLADLDEEFAAGKVPQSEYEAERARLKAELATLLRRKSS